MGYQVKMKGAPKSFLGSAFFLISLQDIDECRRSSN
jgi:hypothetical protein